MTIAMKNSVSIGEKTFPYHFWEGQRLNLLSSCPYVAFDTETEITDLTRQIPRLALATYSIGSRHGLLHPDRIADFILKHPDARFVFHNASFDFWVVDQNLREQGADRAREIWWDACDQNRMHDTMLLDALIRLAQGRAQKFKASDKDWLPLRDLAEVAADYTSLRITKDDPYRTRYGEIIGKDWSDVDHGFFDYAIKDSIVTYRSYLSMIDKAECLMRDHGYDSKKSRQDRHEIVPDAIKRFGLLTEHVQVKGAIALAQLTRTGMTLDLPRVTDLQKQYRKQLDEIIRTFLREYPDVIKLAPDGSVRLNAKSQTPGVNENVLRQRLLQAVEVINTNGDEIKVPMTPKGKISTSAKEWTPHADKHPLIKLWVEREKVSKMCEFFNNLQAGVVHPKYNVLLRTGRTSCTSPNIQQIPRDGGFRELFVPSPGHLLLAIDYGFIELRTLAAICEARYGQSRLADTIRAGTDPHCFTAAMFSEKTLDEFMALRDSPVGAKTFKEYRQNAKAVNFGVPGGLGAASLVEYARATYRVEMNLEQAAAKRHQLITDIYPELNEQDGYLSDDGMALLARNLNARQSDCWNAFDWKGTKEHSVVLCVQKVVRGRPFKKDGTPYKEQFVSGIWNNLNELNRNGDPRLVELLEAREGCEELHRLLFNQAVVTLTGRIRGDVSYTQARNTPFQGLAADGAKFALWKLLYHSYRVVGFVHDELLVELPDQGGYVDKSKCEEVKLIVCEAMAEVTGAIPIDADYTVSKCWSKQAKLLVEGNKVKCFSENVPTLT